MSDTASTTPYCPDLLHYQRRNSREVRVGHVGIGGNNPIRVQSMLTSDTRDTDACVKETLGLAEAGCEIVRITAQTRKYAANLEHIAAKVRAAGCEVPLVADIHFKPDAAMEAAKWVEKVRVNPGNYADKKKFEIREYSDAQYEEEIERIREEFSPLVQRCKQLGRAMRIGTNHGSLSDRIMNRYGDTPLGMVESALEFAHIAREHDYHELIFSMKASNPKVMIEAYRLLVARLGQEGPDWNYPIHLGVTEAGDGEDGRIKSAIGIGSLLADGIGDTIRVSLTEDAVYEIPVARALAEPFDQKALHGGWSVPLQSVSGASRSPIHQHAEAIRPDWNQLAKNTSSFLPHWRIPGACYAVTFRLADSLPESAMREYRQRKSILLEQLNTISRKAGSRSSIKDALRIRSQISDLQQTQLEQALHSSHGECHLANPEVAEMTESALRHFDGERYSLIAWSVMPNHVHAVVKPFPGHELDEILHSWKSFTAKQANTRLNRSGPFWQEDYYDHVIRDGEDYKNQIQYVLENPCKAGADNQWTGSCYGRTWLEIMAAGRGHDGLEQDAPATEGAVPFFPSYNPFSYERRRSSEVRIMGIDLGATQVVRVATPQQIWNQLAERFSTLGDFKPELIAEKSGALEIDPTRQQDIEAANALDSPQLITVRDGTPMETIAAFRLLAAKVEHHHPILLKDTLTPPATTADSLAALLRASQVLGSLLCDGIGDAVLVRGETAPGAAMRLSYNILQAAGVRIFKTDYVACPSCGRTLFNLQSTTQKIRAATGHLKGVRIAVMGCIVNGPGEMADADFGYVGGAPGKINLYVGKQPVQFNIPEDEAVDRLIGLIREHGKWIDPPEQQASGSLDS